MRYEHKPSPISCTFVFTATSLCEMNSEKKLTESPALTDEDDVEDILREEEDTSTSCRRHSISATR